MLKTHTYISPIQWGELSESDIRWLAKADAVMYDGQTGRGIVEARKHGHKALHRIGGGPDGILVTSIQQTTRRILFIDYVAGRGLVAAMKEILTEILDLAELEMCEEILCHAVSPALVKLYKRHGFEIAATVMRL